LKLFVLLFPAGHFVISLMFLVCAVGLIVFSGTELWLMVVSADAGIDARLSHLLNGVALLTVAVAALELSQTILEEEVQRSAHMSAPTRVRRFLSRFMIVLVVSLTIEALVNVFKYSREAPENLPYAASIGLMAAALLAAWGLFIRLNQGAEALEPEAMQEAKREDRKLNDTKQKRS
jgi:hypothetical protein